MGIEVAETAILLSTFRHDFPGEPFQVLFPLRDRQRHASDFSGCSLRRDLLLIQNILATELTMASPALVGQFFSVRLERESHT